MVFAECSSERLTASSAYLILHCTVAADYRHTRQVRTDRRGATQTTYHEYPSFLFFSVPHILHRPVTRLNMRRYEVNRGCQAVLGRVVLALPNIPHEGPLGCADGY